MRRTFPGLEVLNRSFCSKEPNKTETLSTKQNLNAQEQQQANDKAGKLFKPTSYVDPEAYEEELQQLTLIQRYKKLMKDFWYVLLPVHGLTSVLWFGSCFLLASSGVDIDLGSIAGTLGLPDTLKTYLSNPKLGTWAVALACYKLASPFRYMTTVYAVAPAIKLLVRKRLIKPVPRLTSHKRIQAEITTFKNKVIPKRGQ